MVRTRLSAELRRAIPDDFKYNPKKIKYLKKVLHNVSTSLGTLTSALNSFSRMKGPEISPDGLLGGVGYIIPFKDMKQTINTMVHNLSDIADCLADELTNPRWDIKDDKEVKELIKEKDDALDKVEDELEEPEKDNESEEDDSINPEDLVTSVDETLYEDFEETAKDLEKERVFANEVKKTLKSYLK